jgi:hypothetical protein
MSLLAPLGLLLGLLAVPLAALYFLKIRRERITVPSLLLWEELARTERLARPFDRFRNNLLLWLQLLALAAVVLAFARPVFNGGPLTSRSLILVVDTSASMAATDGSPDRLGAAVADAVSVVENLAPGDEATVIAAGPRTEVAIGFTTDAAALRSALRQLSASHARGHLREGLQLALSLAAARSGAEVLVFSDGGQASLADIQPGPVPIVYRKVGSKSGNAGIIALDLRSSPASELERQVFVTVQRFGGGTVAATVQVTLDSQVVGLRNETLADRPVSMVFDLPAGASGALKVDLRADDDHLPLDDRAWAVVQPVRKRNVALIGSDRLTAKVLGSDPRVTFTKLDPTQVTTEALAGQDAVVVVEAAPIDLASWNTAFLHPDAGGPAQLGAPRARPDVIGWRRSHPLMRFVAWDGVQFGEMREVVNAGGLSPLADSTEGPLLLAGERLGRRTVQLTFDPYRTDMPLRVAWPVLVLNTIGWLTEEREGADSGAVVMAGQPWTIAVPSDVAATSVQAIGPEGEDLAASLHDGLLRVQDTTHLGVHEVRAGGRTWRFAANLHDPLESDLTPRDSLDFAVVPTGEVEVAPAAAGGASREGWRWLVLLGVLVLLAEWAAWTLRRSA